MRKYRKKKAEENKTIDGSKPEKAFGSYQCTSTLRKAVKKVQNVLRPTTESFKEKGMLCMAPK